jgi:integrase
MGVILKMQRGGMLRDSWYGVYRESDGTRKVINLNVKVCGTPPGSRSVRDAGDRDFEESRKEAKKALAGYVDTARRKGRAEHLTERLIEAKTGRSVEYARIDALPARWRTLGRESPASEQHLANCDAQFRRFIEFMRERNPEANYLYEVKPEDAGLFVKELRAKLAPATAHYGVRLLAKAFGRFLPVGAMNPFEDSMGRRKNNTSGVVHRKPFTPDELQALLKTAKDDPFMYPLIVTAACSGMRRGDVCNLKWRDVDLAGGMLTVKTSKTESSVEIPIFTPLRAVLDERKGDGRVLVFPEAAAMMKENADGLSYRFKVLVARALDGQLRKALPAPTPAAEIEAEAVAAITDKVRNGTRRARMLDVFRRYAAGKSVRQIAVATGISKGIISYDLHVIQKWVEKDFMRSSQGSDVRDAIDRVTRIKREHGQKSASVRDWHALRTTFVTLALSAGVPVELVRRVTGHATVEVVLKHYFRPDREQFRAALAAAMPEVLTGKESPMRPADELVALATKAAAGTATAKDKARMRKLVAGV